MAPKKATERTVKKAVECLEGMKAGAGLKRLLDTRIALADGPGAVWHDAEEVFAELMASESTAKR